jgi:hypothetical protein
MTTLRTRLSDGRRALARRREARSFARALAAAPTAEDAHELRSLATRG